MTWNKTNIANEPPNENWGGPWTEKKLIAFSKYVSAYLTIMNKNSWWETIYFDGFAGSGTREKDVKTELYKQLSLTEEEEKTYKGAAERVLSLESGLGFNYYYFIDKDESSLKKLETKLEKFNEKNIQFRSGDANQWLQELASALVNNKKYAALVFLDPFGMQIDWDSIEKLKGTRSDVWILVPTGVIVNRMLEKSGELKHINKLQTFFGMTEDQIRDSFYQKETRLTLFGDEQEIVSKVSKPIEKIAQLYIERMKGIWEHVTEQPLRLNNKNGVPIFHFVFGSNNKNALKIAKQIINTL